MSVEFKDTNESLSDALMKTVRSIQGETVTLRQLFGLIGEQGLLFLCALLTIPFLVPVSIPGVSTVFGFGIILIGIGVLLNRIPWLPRRLLDHPLSSHQLIPTLEKGANLVSRIDRIIRPRLLALTEGRVMNRINGFGVILSGVLLMAPLGLIPFSNTLPALAVLFKAVGILQRDGLFVILGYVMMLATMIYFSALAALAFAAGKGLGALFGAG